MSRKRMIPWSSQHYEAEEASSYSSRGGGSLFHLNNSRFNFNPGHVRLKRLHVLPLSVVPKVVGRTKVFIFLLSPELFIFFIEGVSKGSEIVHSVQTQKKGLYCVDYNCRGCYFHCQKLY